MSVRTENGMLQMSLLTGDEISSVVSCALRQSAKLWVGGGVLYLELIIMLNGDARKRLVHRG